MDRAIRAVITGFDRWSQGRRLLVVDGALALLVVFESVFVALTAHQSFPELTRYPDTWWGWLVVVGGAWVVPFRRLAPVRALLVGVALQMAVWAAQFPDTFVATAFLLYSAAAFSPRSRRRWAYLMAVVLTGWTILGIAVGAAPVYVAPLVALSCMAAVSLGTTTAIRQAYLVEAEERAAALARSRVVDRERAVDNERARIARELHDVVAHGVSVMVVQAAAARRILDRDPDGASAALEQIERTGRTALGEMRQVLGAIRTEPAESWRPARGLADIEALAEELGQAGLEVTVRRLGPATATPHVEPGPGLDLPATVDVTAYRVVQEGLTNVLKHGGDGVRATVEVEWGPDELTLRIDDDGQGALAADGGGHGLRGMQERVEVFGGRFRAGPRFGGGFRVEVALPLTGTGHRTGRAAAPGVGPR